MDLDQLLTEAAPPVRRNDQAKAAILEMVDASRAAARPRRRRRRIMIAGTLGVAMVGGTAAATGAIPSGWIPWTTPDHHSCHFSYRVGPAGNGPGALGGEPNMMPTQIDRARQAEEIAAADAFLAHFDYSSIDQARAIEDMRADEAAGLAGYDGHDRTSSASVLGSDDLAIIAVEHEVERQLFDHLTRLGYDMRPNKGSDRYLIVDGGGYRCDG